MKRVVLIAASSVALVLVLAAGAFVGGRLLGAAAEGEEGRTVRVGTGNGQSVEAEWVRAEEYPDVEPDVAGAFARRYDNSLFVDETKGGFVLARNDDGSFSVTNATGKIHEVVVTRDTSLYVDLTFTKIDAALSDGKLYQELRPGSIEEVGELSFVRAWGEKRGDRLIASVVVYTRPPVLSR
ncbi:MAG: hypothetical protein JXA93_07985 [Anaerolineae bacterium]|nr:hypothetical protein [Anaerolineae bacterium]